MPARGNLELSVPIFSAVYLTLSAEGAVGEISIEGRRVFYFECGSGAPIVLLHAGAGSGKQWAKIARLLEPRFRVIAPDLWGFGGTESWAGESELSHDHQASLVIGVIEHLSKEPVHLVGHSYGGATAVRLILRNRDLVQTAVLIEPILPSLLELAGETRLFREYLEMAQSFLRNVAVGDLDRAWRGFLDYRNGPGTWEALPDAQKERFRTATESTVAGFRSNLSNPTSLSDLGRFSVPTLVMCGDKTTVPDRRVAEILRDHIPRCRYELVPGAEHMSPLSHPEFTAGAIERHVRAAL
jgi:pimeloyl-ACP methyl ester carboxylesterase